MIAAVYKREKVYQGLNGEFVERFYLNPKECYIFKPLTNNKQLRKEIWAYEHVLSFFPAIYPKIISSSSTRDPKSSWLILEDLGSLTHIFNESDLLTLVKLVAKWHSFPLERLEGIPLRGQKPPIGEMVKEILLKREEVLLLLPLKQLEIGFIQHMYVLLDGWNFSNRMVLSHGDLHLGNFSAVNNKMMVLDWEHTHLNSPYWDLYHLIDISHPVFPRKMTKDLRNRILHLYLKESGLEVNVADFLREYYLFSSAFSVWMCLLIKKDLHRNESKWTKEQLNRQLDETVLSLRQCLAALSNKVE